MEQLIGTSLLLVRLQLHRANHLLPTSNEQELDERSLEQYYDPIACSIQSQTGHDNGEEQINRDATSLSKSTRSNIGDQKSDHVMIEEMNVRVLII
jgi:hypothetical protein